MRRNNGPNRLELHLHWHHFWHLCRNRDLVSRRVHQEILPHRRRRVSPFANGMATAADWMSAATFISMAGGIAAAGYGASKFLMGWTGGFVLLTTLMVPYLRKLGKPRFRTSWATAFTQTEPGW